MLDARDKTADPSLPFASLRVNARDDTCRRIEFLAGHLWPGPRDFAPFTEGVQGKQGRLHDTAEGEKRPLGFARGKL